MTQKLVIKGGSLLDEQNGYYYSNKDIFIEDGLIKSIEDELHLSEGIPILQLNGEILSPGFIDVHTHVFHEQTSLSIQPDRVGIQSGVTTLLDAGSSGAKNFTEFRDNIINKSQTRVRAFINMAYTGLEQLRYELADKSNLDIQSLKEIVKANPEYIKGIKARASASTVGDLGIYPIKIAKETAASLDLPLMVHIGNPPPKIDDILNLLTEGDIITHCFHGKPNGLLDENELLKQTTQEARGRGVLFDIGHGNSSFNVKRAKSAFSQNFSPDLISTDIYLDNVDGPVYSLAETINKLLAVGLDLESCIKKVTTVPAQALNLDDIGGIRKNYAADFTIFTINDEEKTLYDSDGNAFHSNKSIEIAFGIKAGEVTQIH